MIEAHSESVRNRVKAPARRCVPERSRCRRRPRRKVGLAELENIRYAVAEMRRAIQLFTEPGSAGRNGDGRNRQGSLRERLCLFWRSDTGPLDKQRKEGMS